MPWEWISTVDLSFSDYFHRNRLRRGQALGPALWALRGFGALNFEQPPLGYWLNAAAMMLFGENAFAVPVLTLVPYLAWQRRYSDLFRMSWLPILTDVLVVLPWGILIHSKEPDFWRFFSGTNTYAALWPTTPSIMNLSGFSLPVFQYSNIPIVSEAN